MSTKKYNILTFDKTIIKQIKRRVKNDCFELYCICFACNWWLKLGACWSFEF